MGETERAEPIRAVEGLAARLRGGEARFNGGGAVMTGLISSMTGLTSSSPSVLLSSYRGVSVRHHTSKATHRTKQRILIIVLILITRDLSARLSLPPKPSSKLAFAPQLGLLALPNGRINFIV
jgi:hypothetical protein